MTSEESETVETLLYCFNAVEDELARCYFSLTKKEVMASSVGEISFSNFSLSPIKILSVKSGEKEVEFTTDALSLNTVKGTVTVTYCYVPPKKTIDGESEYGEERVSERLIAVGAAAEYCLICGEVSSAQSWESVYRGEIDRLQRKSVSGIKIPPRRWV